MNWQLSVTDESGLAVDPDNLAAGSRVVVRGTGLPPDAAAQIEFHSTPTILGSATAGADGAFAFATTIPDDADEGDHSIVVIVTLPGYIDSELTVPVTVARASSSGDGSSGDGSSGGGDGSGSGDGEPDPNETGTADGGSPDLASGDLAPGAPTILSALQTIGELRASPPAIAGALIFVLAALLLLALPSALLESTLRENRHRVFRWVAPIGRAFHTLRPRLVATTRLKWTGIAVTTVVSAIITSTADSQFGFNLPTLRLMLSFTVSLLVLNFVATALQYGVGLRALRIAIEPMVYPGGLLLMVLGVLLTRFTGIEPGVLIGLFVGLTTVNALRKQNAEFVLIGAGVTTVLGLLAWVGYSAWAPSVPADADFWSRLGVEILSAITVQGLINFVILLLPLTFLDGKEVWDWSKRAWVLSYAIVLALFVVVLVPLPSTWVELTASTGVLGALFGAFGAVCIGVWAWFRFRPDPHPPADEQEEKRELVG